MVPRILAISVFLFASQGQRRSASTEKTGMSANTCEMNDEFPRGKGKSD